jgi:hypothetical protein
MLLGPDPLTVGVTPVAQGCATAPPVPAGLVGALVLVAGALAVGLLVELDELGLELQAPATSIRAATAPVRSAGWRRPLEWFGSILSTT